MMSDRLLKESDVLKAIDKRIEKLSKDPEFVRKNGIIDVAGVKKYILAIPSADRPKGEWRLVTPKSYTFEGYRCSECNHLSYGRTHFCSECGADMRGDSNE